ncbi:MAG: hypothetical protein JST43_08290 [Bacteroidetes bacterium]|nr:hypothetical protein [Bacteroidota bacterium]MBS1541587.1 hypothetical protein [Bacteroidota bacterium]
MKTKSLQRVFLLAIGLCAVLVILLSHSLYQNSDQAAQQPKKNKDKSEVTIQAPTEVASQGQTGIVNDQDAVVVKELVSDEHKNEIIVFIEKNTIRFFKTLFRVIISPNAP